MAVLRRRVAAFESVNQSRPLFRRFSHAKLLEAAVDPQRRQLLLEAVLRQALAQAGKIDAIESLILVEAGEDDGFLAGRGILLHLQALGADFLHHALHR